MLAALDRSAAVGCSPCHLQTAPLPKHHLDLDQFHVLNELLLRERADAVCCWRAAAAGPLTRLLCAGLLLVRHLLERPHCNQGLEARLVCVCGTERAPAQMEAGQPDCGGPSMPGEAIDR